MHGAAVAPQVWTEKFTSLPFVQKTLIIGEWIKNGVILPMLWGIVLWINSPGSMKICDVKRKGFVTKIKGSMLGVAK